MNVDISSSVFSFGFDLVEPEFDPNVGVSFTESSFTVTVISGPSVVDSFAFSAPNDVAAFVGVASNVAFYQVAIQETIGGIENEFFGKFYTGSNKFPEPSAWIFLSLLGLAATWRNRIDRRWCLF